MHYCCTGKLFRYNGEKAAWYFVGIPKDISADVVKKKVVSRGFGSVRVTVTVGNTSWKTSIFPDSRSGCFLLPVKALVRDREDLDDGDIVKVSFIVE